MTQQWKKNAAWLESPKFLKTSNPKFSRKKLNKSQPTKK